MKLQLQMFEYDRVDETTNYKCWYRIGLMNLQLQIFASERVAETAAANVCIEQGG